MILVIDESELLLGLLDPMLQGSGIQAARVKDIGSAKRRLVESTPKLIVAFTAIGKDREAGYRFCVELRGHPSLSQVPVLLVAEDLNEDVLRKASESGAKGIAPWPISAESLIRRIGSLLPEIARHLESESAVEAKPERPSLQSSSTKNRPLVSSGVQKVVASSGAPPAASRPAVQADTSPTAAARPAAVKKAADSAAGAPTELDRKLQVAQQILARVLYDLKTSHLLQVVDLDDVPRVVAELTRAICSVGPAEKEKRQQVASPADFEFLGKAPSVAPASTQNAAPSGAPSVVSAGVQNQSAGPAAEASPPQAEADPPGVVGIDLEKIFGIKKS